MTKTQYYKRKREIRTVRGLYEGDYFSDAIEKFYPKDIKARKFWEAIFDTLACWVPDLQWRLSKYKDKIHNTRNTERDRITRKIKEAEQEMMIALNKHLFG